MALKDDKIKDLFASKFNDFEPEVPTSVWSGIDEILSEQPILGAAPVKKPRKTLRTAIIGLAVAASIGIGVFLAFDQKTMPIPQGTAIEEMISPTMDKEENTKSPDEVKAIETIVIQEKETALYAYNQNDDNGNHQSVLISQATTSDIEEDESEGLEDTFYVEEISEESKREDQKQEKRQNQQNKVK